MYTCEWGRPTWKALKGYNAKIQAKLLGGRGPKRGRKNWNIIWKENLINLTMFLMSNQTMLRK
jgi:hypothetical protein